MRDNLIFSFCVWYGDKRVRRGGTRVLVVDCRVEDLRVGAGGEGVLCCSGIFMLVWGRRGGRLVWEGHG